HVVGRRHPRRGHHPANASVRSGGRGGIRARRSAFGVSPAGRELFARRAARAMDRRGTYEVNSEEARNLDTSVDQAFTRGITGRGPIYSPVYSKQGKAPLSIAGGRLRLGAGGNGRRFPIYGRSRGGGRPCLQATCRHIDKGYAPRGPF